MEMLLAKYWKHIAVVLVTLFVVAGIYRAGGAAPRAQLAALQQNVKAAHDAQVAEDNRREAEHRSLTNEQDKDRAIQNALTTAGWRAYIAGLPKPTSGASKDTQPVRITAEGLNDAADRERVSAAVSKFRDEVRAAAREFRDEVAGQLEQAQLQTDALIRAQVWAANEQKLNR